MGCYKLEILTDNPFVLKENPVDLVLFLVSKYEGVFWADEIKHETALANQLDTAQAPKADNHCTLKCFCSKYILVFAYYWSSRATSRID